MYCKNCGANIAENDKFCRNCGAPAKFALDRVEKEKAFWRYGWFTILMLFLCFPVGVILVFINHPSVVKNFFMFLLVVIVVLFVAIGFDGCSLSETKYVPYKDEQRVGGTEKPIENKIIVDGQDERTTASSKVIRKPVGFPDQIYFGHKLNDFRAAYDKTDNKLQKSAVRARQVKFLKGYFPDNKFENWKGTVKEIGSVENGKFASINIECCIGDMVFHISTEQFNIMLSGKQTLIESGSKLYDEVFKLKNGDTVEFSAKVIPNKESGLYLDNWVSEAFSVKKPEFIVQFTAIKKVDGY